jgi:hypothetical protein
MAKLMIGQMQDNSSAQEVDRILDSLPAGLEKLYAQIIERIDGQTKDDAVLGRRVLSELLTAQRSTMTVTLLDAEMLDGKGRLIRSR